MQVQAGPALAEAERQDRSRRSEWGRARWEKGPMLKRGRMLAAERVLWEEDCLGPPVVVKLTERAQDLPLAEVEEEALW